MELKILKEPITHVDTVFLDNFRFSNGRGFPLSYREFAKKYGYGLLCKLFLIKQLMQTVFHNTDTTPYDIVP